MPDIQINLVKNLHKFASSSMDISDGLFADLDKLINRQDHSYEVLVKNIPISANLKKIIKSKNFNKADLISRGDDYQILFTSPKSKRKLIQSVCDYNKIRVTKIGKIIKGKRKSLIINEDGSQLFLKNKGYFHNF